MYTGLAMNGRARRTVAVPGTKAALKTDKVMEKDQKKAETTPVKRSTNVAPKGINRSQSRRERKIALQQDVDKLRKKLRHEENVHRALERAFTRPLGALPRLPPYLPSHTLELLAEVAVLEEEVVRLEEQVVNFRQGLFQEAIIISSSTKNVQVSDSDKCPPANGENPPQLKPSTQITNSEASASMRPGSDQDPNWSSLHRVASGKQTPRKPNPSLPARDGRPGKENQLSTTNSTKNFRQSPVKKVPKLRMPVAPEKRADGQSVSAVTDRTRPTDSVGNHSDQVSRDDSSAPNKLSEELLRCLLAIFSQMSSPDGLDEERASSPSVSGSCESSEDADPRDPYGILEFGKRDIGSYKQFRVIDDTSFDPNLLAGNTLLARRLKALLRKLSSVDLLGLSHQQKLAFWINIYNSCMMNAFLEQGIPTSPHMLVATMPKATINVGGRVLSAMTIEHFILRLPYNVKHVNPKGIKSDDMTMRGVFGLEWPEPLVTFALSCGSWSSPAVRVYTASRVEEELETSKRDYLQAAVGISTPTKLAIPKLLHWYLLDFAKDVDSLMDWICLQLPSELQHNAVKLVETGRRSTAPRPIQVLPYVFRFRYLFAS